MPNRYFQCGVSNFLLGRYELAYKDFEEALLYLRGNQAINYEQLGLQFRLYSAEVLFNKGLCHIYLGGFYLNHCLITLIPCQETTRKECRIWRRPAKKRSQKNTRSSTRLSEIEAMVTPFSAL
jgi:hypothetical protein